jgi:NAD(P)-dependent dehydrogenase (short-subunit alcohol dehydrogenase family)
MSAEYLEEMFGLKGQTAVVIGGAGVLGGALCSGLVRAGARVIVADITEEACRARLEQLGRPEREVGFCLVDLTSRASTEDLLAGTLEQTGRVDILVNCAGVNFGSSFLEHIEEAWDRVLAINLKGVFQACQVFGRHMVEADGGAILNIGSVTSYLPLSRVFGYSASKAGVLSLTRNIAQEFASKGVRVNAICPGFFPAEQNRKLLDQTRIDNIIRHTPMGRFGEPEELIGAMLLLVSPKAGRFITGAAVNVDGGFTAAWF